VTSVVVLGGGFGGAAAAIALRAIRSPHSVVLIDREETGHLAGDNPFIVVGARRRHEVARHLGDLEGVDFVAAEIERIGASDHIVHTSRGSYPFDYLVIALGSTYDWDAVPGARDGYGFYELEHAERLHERLRGFTGGTIAVGVAGAPIKCPPAPFEMMLMIDWWLRERGLRDVSELHVAIPGPAPLAIAGPGPSAMMASALEARGIVVHTGAAVTALDAGSMLLGDGTELSVDVPITVPIHRPPPVVGDLLEGAPWMRVDRATLETPIPDVFAVGDVNVVPIGSAALPKAGVFAAGEGRTAGGVIAARIDEVEPPAPYDGVGHCFVAFSGGKGAEIGGRFFADGGPDVALATPSREGMEGKERFDERWKAFRV
jgi:sulfide:quinone oxidoreductase